jgi:hypothetical protein
MGSIDTNVKDKRIPAKLLLVIISAAASIIVGQLFHMRLLPAASGCMRQITDCDLSQYIRTAEAKVVLG